MGRLVTFLSKNKYLRALGFLILVPISLLYDNEALQMMAFYWAATAYDFNQCIGNFYCRDNNNIIGGYYNYYISYF